jgi:hypothetical protein
VAGYRELLQNGELAGVDEIDEDVRWELRALLIRFKAKGAVATLKEQLDYYSPEAYEALAKYHFGSIAEQLRRDLDDEFETFKGESLQRARVRFGQQVVDLYSEWEKKESLGRYLRETLTTAALGAIVENGEKRDAKYGSRFITSARREIQLMAIKVLERHGDESDCGLLVDIAKKEIGVRREAATAALNVSKRSTSVLRMLLDSNIDDLVRIALSKLSRDDLQSFHSDLRVLAHHDSSSIRILAVACLHQLMTQEELETFLSDYLSNRTYFYNIVCWLDRILYSPGLIKELYARKLREALSPRN